MSMKNVISRALAKKQIQKQTATDEYRDLLHKHATVSDELWTEADETRLLELIAELKISDEQAMKDSGTVKDLIEFAKIASTRLQANNAYVAADKAHAKVLDERQKMFAEINAKVAKSFADQQAAWDRFDHANKTAGLLEKLKADHPQLVK